MRFCRDRPGRTLEVNVAQWPSVEAGVRRTEQIPMGRFGEPDEITAMICWLASDEMSFSTGAVFDVSGGRATY
jgi:NAD(P)-dependent dehydrogenase (short-subunit alcohol dehydrogenase family)